MAACTSYSWPIVLTALNTGIRKREILGLKWEQVDLTNRVITILFSKNGRIRKIPINNVLLETFLDLKEKSESRSMCSFVPGPRLRLGRFKMPG